MNKFTAVILAVLCIFACNPKPVTSPTVSEACPEIDQANRDFSVLHCAFTNHPRKEVSVELLGLLTSQQLATTVIDSKAEGDDGSTGMHMVVDASFRVLPQLDTPFGKRDQPVLQISPRLIAGDAPIKLLQRRIFHESRHIADYFGKKLPPDTFQLKPGKKYLNQDDVLRAMRSEVPAYVAECKFAEQIGYIGYRPDDVCLQYLKNGENGVAVFMATMLGRVAPFAGHQQYLLEIANKQLWRR